MNILSKNLYLPDLRFVSQFPTHPTLIQAHCALAAPYLSGSYDHILFSFHGLPQRHLKKIDARQSCLKLDCCEKWGLKNLECYSAQCYATTQAIAAELKLPKGIWSISFQSRLGKEPWMEPYTNEVILSLAKQGKKRILVFCPSFVCDCLETLYEIGVEYTHEFKQAGGESVDLVRGLNDHPLWIQTLAELAATGGS